MLGKHFLEVTGILSFSCSLRSSCLKTELLEDKTLYWAILVQLVVGNLSVSICHQLCSWHTDCSCHLIMSEYKASSDLCEASGGQQNAFVSLDCHGFYFWCSPLSGVNLMHMIQALHIHHFLLLACFSKHMPVRGAQQNYFITMFCFKDWYIINFDVEPSNMMGAKRKH